MTVTTASDINDLYSISSDAVRSTVYGSDDEDSSQDSIFGTLLNAAVSNITDTNTALSNQENEELKWAMGISEDTHDLTVAVGKAETALSYTVALRDKLLDAYQEIMQMQM